jgi:hypothetical protein
MWNRRGFRQALIFTENQSSGAEFAPAQAGDRRDDDTTMTAVSVR